jgi:hypothetical protein
LEECKSNRLLKGKVKFLTIMKATSVTIGREKDTKPGTRTSTTCAGIGCKNSFNSGIFVMLKKL